MNESKYQRIVYFSLNYIGYKTAFQIRRELEDLENIEVSDKRIIGILAMLVKKEYAECLEKELTPAVSEATNGRKILEYKLTEMGADRWKEFV